MGCNNYTTDCCQVTGDQPLSKLNLRTLGLRLFAPQFPWSMVPICRRPTYDIATGTAWDSVQRPSQVITAGMPVKLTWVQLRRHEYWRMANIVELKVRSRLLLQVTECSWWTQWAPFPPPPPPLYKLSRLLDHLPAKLSFPYHCCFTGFSLKVLRIEIRNRFIVSFEELNVQTRILWKTLLDNALCQS